MLFAGPEGTPERDMHLPHALPSTLTGGFNTHWAEARLPVKLTRLAIVASQRDRGSCLRTQSPTGRHAMAVSMPPPRIPARSGARPLPGVVDWRTSLFGLY